MSFHEFEDGAERKMETGEEIEIERERQKEGYIWGGGVRGGEKERKGREEGRER